MSMCTHVYPGMTESAKNVSRELFPNEDYDQEEVLVEPSKTREERGEGVGEGGGEGVGEGGGEGVREGRGDSVGEGGGEDVREGGGEGVGEGRGDSVGEGGGEDVREGGGECVGEGGGECVGEGGGEGVREGGGEGVREGGGEGVREGGGEGVHRVLGSDVEDIVKGMANLSIHKDRNQDSGEKRGSEGEGMTCKMEIEEERKMDSSVGTPLSQLMLTGNSRIPETTDPTVTKRTYILG